MFDENLIDGLIQAGWYVLESNFDERAFLHWKQSASLCLGDPLGKDHVYVRFLQDYVRQVEKRDLLAGEGILSAAREEVVKRSSPRAVRACSTP